jgi:long-subunit acyl-CoA synthetase (AMP-forming)
VLIETEIIKVSPILSQVVVIGDLKNYLTCLVALKMKSPTEIADEVLEYISKAGSSAKTLPEAIKCPIVNNIIKESLAEANKKAISNAQRVQKHTILPAELTLESGALTPTMKVKRKVVHAMY